MLRISFIIFLFCLEISAQVTVNRQKYFDGLAVTIVDTFYLSANGNDIQYHNGTTTAVTSRFGESSNLYRGLEFLFNGNSSGATADSFGIPIPVGSTILSAILILRANTSTSATTVVDIYSDLNDNPASVMSYADFTANTNFSTETYQYTAPSYTDLEYYSIDITAIVQGRVNHANWTLNDNLGILIKGETVASAGFREIKRREDGATEIKLAVTYR